MKILRCLGCEWKRMLCFPPFVVCCLLVTALEFTAGLYLVNGDKQLSVMETLLTLSRDELKQRVSLSAFGAFQSGIGSWLMLFVPIAAALPFVALYRDEVSTGYLRLRICSIGRIRYCFVKFFSCFFAGGMTLAVGTALFGICVCFLFPPLSVYDRASIDIFLEALNGSSVGMVIIKQFMVLFLYGGFWSITSFALLGFVHNKYLIVGIPFVIKYIWRETYFKLDGKGVGPEQLFLLFQKEESVFGILIVYGILCVCSFLLFFIMTMRKEELGV